MQKDQNILRIRDQRWEGRDVWQRPVKDPQGDFVIKGC